MLVVLLYQLSLRIHTLYDSRYVLIKCRYVPLVVLSEVLLNVKSLLDLVDLDCHLAPYALSVFEEIHVLLLNVELKLCDVLPLSLELSVILLENLPVTLIQKVHLVLDGFTLLFDFIKGRGERLLLYELLLFREFDKLDHASVKDFDPLNDLF